MKILGNRVLVSRIEEEKREGFQTVEVQDSFVNKGKVEQIGEIFHYEPTKNLDDRDEFISPVFVGDTVLFAKYSPDSQEIDKDHKIISVEDILAIL